MARVGSLFKIFISKVTDYLIVVLLFLAYFDSKKKRFHVDFYGKF
jgi:cadmium resistance protein CadD (predicted permease)